MQKRAFLARVPSPKSPHCERLGGATLLGRFRKSASSPRMARLSLVLLSALALALLCRDGQCLHDRKLDFKLLELMQCKPLLWLCPIALVNIQSREDRSQLAPIQAMLPHALSRHTQPAWQSHSEATAVPQVLRAAACRQRWCRVACVSGARRWAVRYMSLAHCSGSLSRACTNLCAHSLKLSLASHLFP